MTMTLIRLTTARRSAVAAILALGAVLACNDATAPNDVRQTGDLHFLRPALNAPPLAASVVAFWAVRGQDREARIWYRPAIGQTDSSEFVEFKVPGAALLKRPDGTSIAAGDSVLITITVLDATRLIVGFEPSGLQFDPHVPARLKIRFAETDDDYNEDGHVDATDESIKQQFSLWRQEAVGQPWFKVFSVVVEDLEEVEADITGFTSYAIAY